MSDPYQLLLILRVALVAILYLVILQIVAVSRRDMKLAGAAPPDPARTDVVARLIVMDKGSTPLRPGYEFEIGPFTTIGRAPTNTIVLDSTFVSAEHTRIRFEEQLPGQRHLWVDDMGSKNPTQVNRMPVTQATAVGPGATLQVGDVLFKIAAPKVVQK